MSYIQLAGDSVRDGQIGDLVRDESGELMGEPLDSISLELHEPSGQNAIWELTLRVNTGYGWALLGQLLTATATGETTPNRVVAIATCPGARAWHIEGRLSSGPATATGVLRAALSRYGVGHGVTALNRAFGSKTQSIYAHDAGTAAGTTTVPAHAVVTHIAAEADPAGGGATIQIGTGFTAQPPIDLAPGQVFELPTGATDSILGEQTIDFTGDIAARFVSWKF